LLFSSEKNFHLSRKLSVVAQNRNYFHPTKAEKEEKQKQAFILPNLLFKTKQTQTNIADIKMHLKFPCDPVSWIRMGHRTVARHQQTDFEFDDWAELADTLVRAPHIKPIVRFAHVPDKDTPMLFLDKIELAEELALEWNLYTDCKTTDTGDFKEPNVRNLLERALAMGESSNDDYVVFCARKWLMRFDSGDERVVPMTQEELKDDLVSYLTLSGSAPAHFRIHAPAGVYINTLIEAIPEALKVNPKLNLVVDFCGGAYNAESQGNLLKIAALVPTIPIHFSRTLMLSKFDSDGKLIPNSEPKEFKDLGYLLPASDEVWTEMKKKNPRLYKKIGRVNANLNSELIAPHKIFEQMAPDDAFKAKLKDMLEAGDLEGYYRLLCPNGAAHPEVKFPPPLARLYCDGAFERYIEEVKKYEVDYGLTISGRLDGKSPQWKVIDNGITASAPLADTTFAIADLAVEKHLGHPTETLVEFKTGHFELTKIPMGKGKFKIVSQVVPVKEEDQPDCLEVHCPNSILLLESFRARMRTNLLYIAGLSAAA
jgi:hypothetical protein